MSIQYVDQNADAIGTVLGTYSIVGGTNAALQITIDGGSAQNFTLTAGGARTVSQVVADINATLTGGTAYVSRGFVRIRTTSALGASSSVVIGAPSNNANSTLGLTAATYTGWSRTSTTYTSDGTKQSLINGLEAIMLTVGWTTISGHGTTNLLMQSRFTPPGQDLVVRVRFKDNAGSCVQVTLENYSATLAGTSSTTAGGNLLPAASKVFKVIANGYHFFVFTGITTVAREFVHCGTFYLPPHLQGIITDAGVMGSNGISDSSASLAASLRTTLTMMEGSSAANLNLLANSTFWQNSNNGLSANIGSPSLVALQTALLNSSSNPQLYTWADSSALEYDAIIGYGPANSGAGATATAKGLLFDAFCITDSIIGDSVVSTSDGHTAIALTDTNVGSANNFARGTLFLIAS